MQVSQIIRSGVLSIWVVISCSLALLSASVAAEEVSGLYDVEVAVESQNSRDRRAASREALKIIFRRLTGSNAAMKSAAIRAAVAKPDKYMKQFQYRSRRVASPDIVSKGSVSKGSVSKGSVSKDRDQLFVMMEFEQNLLDQLIREAGLSLWSSNRPTILLWLTIEDSDGRRFVSEDSDAQFIEAIVNRARESGLAVKLPFIDLQDTVAVSPEEAWNLDSRRFQEAALRYGSDTILLAKVSKLSNGQLLGLWSFQFDGERMSYEVETDNVVDYIAQGLAPVAQLLASQYAVSPSRMAGNGVLLRLSGIANFIDYARAITYLESVSAIHHANVVNISGDTIIVRLIADGILDQLKQAFALDKKLAEADVAGDESGYQISLSYQWR